MQEKVPVNRYEFDSDCDEEMFELYQRYNFNDIDIEALNEVVEKKLQSMDFN